MLTVLQFQHFNWCYLASNKYFIKNNKEMHTRKEKGNLFFVNFLCHIFSFLSKVRPQIDKINRKSTKGVILSNTDALYLYKHM